MTTRFTRTTSAMAGVLALGMAAAAPAAFLPQASAVIINPSVSPALPPSLIKADATGSLIIHKRAGIQAGEATGNELEAPPGSPLKDVKFLVEKVQADLSTNSGFAAASKLTPAEAKPDPEFSARTLTTDADGLASLTGLKVGVYRVTEQQPESVASGSPALVPAKPFLVFLPMTNPDNPTEWNYDIHVYPKNTNVSIQKKVDDAGKHSGDKLKWTLNATIPAPLVEFVENSEEGEPPAEGEGTQDPKTKRQVKPLTAYEISDQLPTNRVDVAETDITVTPPAEMVRDEDYTVTLAPGVDGDHTELKVTFLPAGLLKLAEAYQEGVDPAPTVQVEILGSIKPTGLTGDGITINKEATVTANNSDGPSAVASSNAVETRHRPVVITKQDEATKDKLAGAEFDLYTCVSADQLGDKITLNNEATPNGTLVTDANGQITIDALHVTDFVNNQSDEAAKYCLVETKAPDGYELLTKPFVFDLPSIVAGTPGGGASEGEGEGGGEGESTSENTLTLKLAVDNIKSTSANLPLTGGPGIIALVIAGLALIGGGAWYGLRSSRKS